jgi:hypothetical protein
VLRENPPGALATWSHPWIVDANSHEPVNGSMHGVQVPCGMEPAEVHISRESRHFSIHTLIHKTLIILGSILYSCITMIFSSGVRRSSMSQHKPATHKLHIHTHMAFTRDQYAKRPPQQLSELDRCLHACIIISINNMHE